MAIRTPLKAIRAKCFDCCCGQFQEIKLCTVKDCPLYEYRMGKRPKSSGLANNFMKDSDRNIISPETPDCFENVEIPPNLSEIPSNQRG